MTISETLQKTVHSKEPPGPSSLQAVKHMLAFRDDPLTFLTHLTREYGDVCQVFLPIGPVIVVNHPDYLRQILVKEPFRYDKSVPLWRIGRLLMGEGLPLAEGATWQKQRRLLQPAFHKPQLASFAQILTESILIRLRRWDDLVNRGEPIDLLEEMEQLMLFLLSKTIFSDLDLGEQLDALFQGISESANFLGQYFQMPFPPLFVPTKKNRGFKQTIRDLDRVIYGLIDHRRSQATPGADLLGLLLSARDEESGEGMSDLQLRDELVTFFAVGSDTTANALSWVYYLLSQHREVEARLQEEVDRVLGSRLPTSADLPELVYTRMVINEALRLYPPGALTMRRSLEEQEIGGYRIKKHASLLYSPFLLHRHPHYWQDAERFWPERFSPEQKMQRHPYAYLPFNAGPRICIGQHYALMEMMLVLSIVASRYHLQLVPGQSVEPTLRITLVPRNGLKMYIRTRGK